jgi:hypothetical protein
MWLGPRIEVFGMAMRYVKEEKANSAMKMQFQLLHIIATLV